MLKNTTIVLSALMAMAFSQWLLMSFISRNAGVMVLGSFSFSLTLVTPMIAILGLGFRWLIITEVDYSNNLTVVLVTRAILLATICPLMMIGLSFLFPDSNVLIMALPILATKIAEALSDVCYGKAHGDNRFAVHGMSVFIRVIIGGVFFYLAFAQSGSVPIALMAIAIAWFAIFIAFDLRKARESTTVRHPNLLKKAVRFIGPAVRRGWPLSFASGVGATAIGTSNYALMYYWGAEEVGFYAAFFSFVAILNLGAIAVGQAALPVLTRLFRDRRIRTFVLVLTGPMIAITLIVFAISLIFQVVAEPVVTFLFGPDVAVRASSVAAFMQFAMPVILSQYLSYVMTATTSYRYLIVAPLLSLAAAVLTALIIVPTGGLAGAQLVLFTMGATHLGTSFVILAFLVRRQLLQVPST